MSDEREATIEDMARFWPDKTPAELAAAYESVKAAGGTLTVSAVRDDECRDCDCATEMPYDENDPGAYPGPNEDCDCECH